MIKFTSLGPLDLSASIEEAHEKDVYRIRKLGTIANLSSKSQKNVSEMRYWTFEKKTQTCKTFFQRPFHLENLFSSGLYLSRILGIYVTRWFSHSYI